MVKKLIDPDPDRLPLTAEAVEEELAFDAAQAKTGGQLKRIASGYVQTEPGVIRHFVFSGGQPKNLKQPPQPLQTPDWLHLPHPTVQNPAMADLSSRGTN